MNRKVSGMTAKLLSEQLEDWNYLLRWVRSRVTQACEGKKSRVSRQAQFGMLLRLHVEMRKGSRNSKAGFQDTDLGCSYKLENCEYVGGI